MQSRVRDIPILVQQKSIGIIRYYETTIFHIIRKHRSKNYLLPLSLRGFERQKARDSKSFSILYLGTPHTEISHMR